MTAVWTRQSSGSPAWLSYRCFNRPTWLFLYQFLFENARHYRFLLCSMDVYVWCTFLFLIGINLIFASLDLQVIMSALFYNHVVIKLLICNIFWQLFNKKKIYFYHVYMSFSNSGEFVFYVSFCCQK